MRGSLRSRRRVLQGILAGIVAPGASAVAQQRRIVLNDASRQNATPVFSHWVERNDDEAGFIARLRQELKDASAARRSVAVGAARHSMGGQSLPRNGHAMTFDINRCIPDPRSRAFKVHAGTRWHEVVSTLDSVGFSPAVMQSNSDFGVAATFCVNAHGWPTPYGPFGHTVRAFRIMLSDGTILNCSRSQNQELFKLCMGGYGLFGILLDLEVDMVENQLMKPRFEVLQAEKFAERFVSETRDPQVKMIYGRLNVSRADFFREALLVSYRPEPTPDRGLPSVHRGGGLMGSLSSSLYRAQLNSEAGKRARWFAETVAGPKASSGIATRNSLMNEPVSNLANPEKFRVDILHEYFVAPEQFNAFLSACREIIPKAKAEFLNVTLRYVRKDEESVLSYAKTDRIAAVMSFSQELTDEGERDMIETTEALIDRVGAIGGSFYLPYRLHARTDQIRSIYPSVESFVERKRHYDPRLLFRNALWDAYFSA